LFIPHAADTAFGESDNLTCVMNIYHRITRVWPPN